MAGRGDIKAGAAFVELYVRNSALYKGLAQAKQRLEDFGASAIGIGSKLLAAGAAISAPFIAALTAFAKNGSELNDMSERTGVAAGALAELGYAAQQTGGSLEDVETGIRKMQKTLQDAAGGSKEAGKAFLQLGLEADKLKKLSPDEQFSLIGERLAAIKDPTERAAAAMAVFGKSGTKLLPMLGDMKALREEARRLGAMTSEEAKQADDLGDAWDRIKTVGVNLANSIATSLAPSMMEIFKVIQEGALLVQKFVRENAELIRTVAKVGVIVAGAGAAILTIGVAAKVAAFGVGVVMSGMTLLAGGLAAILSPIGLVVAAVAGVAVAAYRMNSGLAKTGDVASSSMKALSKIASVATGAAAAIIGIGVAWKLVTIGIMAATSVLGILQAAYLALLTPAGIVVASIAGIGLAIVALNGGFRNFGATLASVGNLFAPFGERASAVFGQILQDFSDTWGGIIDAIQGGDLGLAGEVAMSGLAVVFTRGANEVGAIWSSVKWGFLQTWTEATSDLATIFTKAWAGIQIGWVLALAHMKTNLAEFAASTQTVAAEIKAALADAKTISKGAMELFITDIEYARGAITKETRDEMREKIGKNAKGEIGQRDADKKKEIERIEAEKNANIAKITGERASGIVTIDNDAKSALGNIEKDRTRETNENNARYDEELAKRKDALTTAQNELKTKRTEAAEKKAEREKKDADRPKMDGIDFEGLQATGATSGVTFSASALMSIGSGDRGPAERAAKAAEEQKTLAAQQLKAMEDARQIAQEQKEIAKRQLAEDVKLIDEFRKLGFG